MLLSVRPNEAVFASVGVEKSYAIALPLQGQGRVGTEFAARVDASRRNAS
jgi:hypothetical protein